MSSRSKIFPETTEECIKWIKNRNHAFSFELTINEYSVKHLYELIQVGKFSIA
jgi:hypothetical protein